MDKDFTPIAEECYPCVLNQARSASRFAELSDEQAERIIAVAEKELEKSKTTPLVVQHIVRSIADAIILEKGDSPDFDTYAKVKAESNTLAMDFVEKFQKRIEESVSPLDTGLQIAAAGNIIDFGAKNHGALDLHHELRELDKTPFTRYDIESLRETLAKAESLLYLCDNAGEIVFDMLFVKVLKQEYPRLQIVAALRDKPIINDATLEDAHAVGLADLVPVISSGSVYPGTILAETTTEFQELFATADVILSKGQGNFETLLTVADQRLFFVLRIKCEYMANLSGVAKDSLVLMQGGRQKDLP